jgi:hypothetical protein
MVNIYTVHHTCKPCSPDYIELLLRASTLVLRLPLLQLLRREKLVWHLKKMLHTHSALVVSVYHTSLPAVPWRSAPAQLLQGSNYLIVLQHVYWYSAVFLLYIQPKNVFSS